MEMEGRQERGLEIARQKQVEQVKDGWLVKSQSGNGYYHVGEDFDCDCPDYQKNKATCKHAYAVRHYLQAETPMGEVIHKERLTYSQAWKAYDAAQIEEIRLFDELLKDLVAGIEEPAYGFGRPRLSLKEQAFCAVQKVYSQLSCRRAVSLFGNAVAKGQITHKPHYGSTAKFLNCAETTPLLERLISLSAAPLNSIETDFAVDSTGFSTSQFGSYCQEKYRAERRHEFIKAHACVGVKTNIVTSVEVTGENGADIVQFQALVEKTANGGFSVKEVSADKAYSSRMNLETVAELGGTAYIPFKKNATDKMGCSLAWKRLYHYFQLHADEFYEHYHKRSNVESTFAAIKKKFGEKLKSKNPIARKNELLCKILAYNLTVVIQEMKELGITPDFCFLSSRSVSKVN